MSINPIRQVCWNKGASFGGAISQMIVAHVAGRPAVRSEQGEADLFALGSIRRTLACARKSLRSRKVHLWGAGTVSAPGARETGP